MSSPLEQVLEGLANTRPRGKGWDAFCPAHGDDKSRHLYVSEAEDGRVLANCKKGCTFREIFQALGMEPKDAFPKPIREGKRRQFPLRDHTGRVTAIHHRDDTNEEKKGMWWTTPNGEKGLGGLKGDSLPLWGAEAVSSVDNETPIVVCEGEKSAFALTYRGIPAVGTVTGAAGTPSPDSLSVLKERKVILWPDADEPGLLHMRRIGKQLVRMGCEVSWFEWEEAEEHGDAADHPAVRKGHVEEIREALYSAPEFIAPHDPATDGATTFAHALPALEKLLDLSCKTNGVTGLRTGIVKIDNLLHGLNPGYSYLVAARPNIGKSLLVGQIALTVAEQSGRVLLQTPEMSEIQYLQRFACHMAGINYFDAQGGKINAGQRRSIMEAARVISKLPLLVDDYGTQTIERIHRNIERNEPDLLVVDYLQYLTPDDSRASRTQQVGQLSRDLARIKSDYNIPILVAAQLNRSSEQRNTSAPLLSDLRDSGELEQDADVVLMLDRPNKDKGVEPEDEDIMVYCRKNRMGQLWHTVLKLVPGQQWLSDQYDAITGRAV